MPREKTHTLCATEVCAAFASRVRACCRDCALGLGVGKWEQGPLPAAPRHAAVRRGAARLVVRDGLVREREDGLRRRQQVGDLLLLELARLDLLLLELAPRDRDARGARRHHVLEGLARERDLGCVLVVHHLPLVEVKEVAGGVDVLRPQLVRILAHPLELLLGALALGLGQQVREEVVLDLGRAHLLLGREALDERVRAARLCGGRVAGHVEGGVRVEVHEHVVVAPALEVGQHGAHRDGSELGFGRVLDAAVPVAEVEGGGLVEDGLDALDLLLQRRLPLRHRRQLA
mmetsp:Transcript_15320/g.37989  ORF Transcript_15320/g.37989 Transcript_15320/m.37989 type:complete len:289 (+) Transcript_15320:127-993(+)